MPATRRLTFCLLLGSTALTTGCATQPGAPVADGYAKPSYMRTAKTGNIPATRAVVLQNTAYLNTRGIESSSTETVKAEALQVSLQPKSHRDESAAPRTVVPVASAEAQREAPAALVAYTVKPADSLFKIASAYQTTVNAIMAQNNLKSVSDVHPGDVLQVPAGTYKVESAWGAVKGMLASRPETGEVKIAPVVVAVRKPVDMAVIEPAAGPSSALNGRQMASLKPAVALAPQPVEVAQPAVRYVEHTVQQKETIFRISQQYGVSVLDIMEANSFDKPQDLKWGTKVRVPVVAKPLPQPQPVAAVKPAVAAPVVPEAQMAARLEAAETKAKTAEVPQQVAAPVAAPDPESTVKPSVFAKSTPKKTEALKAEMKRGQVDAEAAQSPGLAWPVKGKIVQRFGDAANGVSYTGINIAVPAGTSVVASDEGTVLYADDGLKTYGKMVLLRHKSGLVSAYAHNSFLLVRKGEKVKKGQVIATSGATGNVESPQLHFELRQHASAVDPLRVLPKL